MKRLFLLSTAMILLLIALCGQCFAAPEPISVDVWVDISNGGTAVITTENNAPLPEDTRITVEDDKTESFSIVFTEAGDYSYTLRVEPDERDIEFDTSVYNIVIYVVEEDGVLHSLVVVYNYYSGEKYAPYDPESGEPLTVMFINAPDVPDDPSVPTDKPDDPDNPDNPNDPDGHTIPIKPNDPPGGSGTPINQPKTGDDTMLGLYLIAAILASAGLFMLSIIYYIYVDKFVTNRAR